MSFYSVAVIILIAYYRRSDVKARSQNEENQFVQKPTWLYSHGPLYEDNSYLDSTHQEYHQITPATVTVTAATITTTAPPKRKPSKVAGDRHRHRHRHHHHTAAAFSDDLSQNAAATTNAKTVTTSGFSRIANLDGAASSLNEFALASNTASASAPALPPAPPPPLSFSFPPAGPAFGQFGSSSYAGFGAAPINFGTSHGGGGGGGGSGSSEGAYNDVQPIIHKSVYVHVAPQEDEVPKQKVILPKIAPKKNYQIVFIKAPTPAPPSAPVIPPFPPQSDKTLIYVLHPKPEEAPPIHIPAPPQNAPAKPEVYFIKYKTKKEQEEDDIHGGHGGDVEIDDEDGRYHHRRYGRDGLEEAADKESESLDIIDTASDTRSSAMRSSEYNEPNDTSGESSNIIRIYTIERRGKNTH